MRRAFEAIIATLFLVVGGCQGEPGPEETPAEPVEKVVEVEEAPIEDAMCDMLRSKHAEQIKQIRIVVGQLDRAEAEEARARVENLRAKVTDGLQKEARTRAEMRRRSCEDIPLPPEELLRVVQRDGGTVLTF